MRTRRVKYEKIDVRKSDESHHCCIKLQAHTDATRITRDIIIIITVYYNIILFSYNNMILTASYHAVGVYCRTNNIILYTIAIARL